MRNQLSIQTADLEPPASRGVDLIIEPQPEPGLGGGLVRRGAGGVGLGGGTGLRLPGEGRRGRRREAFTLVEMLLVLVILATLAAIVIPRFAGRSQQARVTAAQSQIASFQLALDAFEVDNGFYPPTSPGLNALVQQPSNAPDWRGPYLRKGVPLDPWGNPYTYEYPGRRNPDGYDLMSMGLDQRVGGGDDITNWDEPQR
jgi:general secretion pathway protein G